MLSWVIPVSIIASWVAITVHGFKFLRSIKFILAPVSIRNLVFPFSSGAVKVSNGVGALPEVTVSIVTRLKILLSVDAQVVVCSSLRPHDESVSSDFFEVLDESCNLEGRKKGCEKYDG